MIAATNAPWCRTPRRSGLTASSADAALAKSVHDPTTGQIVWRELDPHAVARHDADSIPLHSPADVAERLVSVVELNTEQPATQSLRDLPFELDLLFCAADDASIPWRVAATRCAAAHA